MSTATTPGAFWAERRSPVVMFLDPHVMVDAVARGARALQSSTSLTAAEDAFEAFHGIIPETRYLPVVQFAKPRAR